MPAVTRDPIRITGVILDTDAPIRMPRIVAPVAGETKRARLARVTTEVIATVRSSEGPAIEAAGFTPPDPGDPSTLRHCPYVKTRIAGCGRSFPLFADLGETIHRPEGAAMSFITPRGWVVSPRPGQSFDSGSGASFRLWDLWIWLELEALDCCPGQQSWRLTDSYSLPVGTSIVVVPPYARCLTIHKGGTTALTLAWVSGALNVGTSGLPANPSFLSTAVPDSAQLTITNGGAEPVDVILVWGCERN